MLLVWSTWDGICIWEPLGINLALGKVALTMGTAADISLGAYMAVNPIQLFPSGKEST